MRLQPAATLPLLFEIAMHLERRVDEHLYFDATQHDIPAPASRTCDYHDHVEIAVSVSIASQPRARRQHANEIGAKLGVQQLHHECDDCLVVHISVPGPDGEALRSAGDRATK